MNGGRIRRLTDVAMTLCLFFLMGFPFFGMTAHMVAGALFFLLLAFHHWLNRKWAPSLRRGRWNAVRKLQVGANAFLSLTIFGLLWSGLILARPAVGFIPYLGSMSLGRELHLVSAYWGFLAMSFHVGLHGDMFASMTRKAGAMTKRALSATSLLLALYGVWALWSRDWLSHLFLQTEFVFFDFEESKVVYYLDHVAIMALFVWLGWQAMLWARRAQRKR